MERAATGGSVALTFQVSFKQNLPALYSESTAHPDRKKASQTTVSLLFVHWTIDWVLKQITFCSDSRKSKFVQKKKKKKSHIQFL